MKGFSGEPPKQCDIDGGTELSDDVSFDAKPASGSIGAATVEPFSRLEPIAESAGIVVEREMFEDKG